MNIKRSRSSEVSPGQPKIFRRSMMKRAIMRSLVGLMIFLSSWAVSSVMAATIVTLDNGVEVRFKDGQFDAKSFNMRVNSVEFYNDGKLFALADTMRLEVEPHADGKHVIVKDSEMTGFVLPDKGLEFGKVVLRNLMIKDKGNLFAADFDRLADSLMDNAYIGLFDFLVRHDEAIGFDAYVHAVEISPLRLKALPNGDIYYSELGLRGAMDLTRRDDNSQTKSLSQNDMIGYAALQKLNFDKIKLAFDIQHKMSEDGVLLYAESTGNLDIEQQFVSGFNLAMQMPLASFYKMENAAELEGEEAFFALLQSDAALANFSFDIRDRGLLGKVMAIIAEERAQSVDAARAEISLMLDQAMREALPAEGAKLAMAIDHFLRQGGKLRIAMTPDEPLPLISLGGFLIAPDLMVRTSNITTQRLD